MGFVNRICPKLERFEFGYCTNDTGGNPVCDAAAHGQPNGRSGNFWCAGFARFRYSTPVQHGSQIFAGNDTVVLPESCIERD